MSYTGGFAKTFASRHERAVDGALEGACQEIINGLKEPKPNGLAGGYTSGDFVTGFNLNAIFQTETFRGPSGARFRLVSTDSPYAVYWEMGHFNIFSRRYEREERWGPTLSRKYDDAMAAYARVYKRLME